MFNISNSKEKNMIKPIAAEKVCDKIQKPFLIKILSKIGEGNP